MNGLRRIISSTIISLVGQATTWTSTVLLTIAYGHYLTAVTFGELYFALSFVLLIGTPLEYSFNTQITRDVAQEPGKALSYFSNVFLMKAALWVVLYATALFICRLPGYNGEEQVLVAICGLNLLSDALGSTVRALHYAFERVYFPVIASIIEKVLAAVFGIFFLRAGAGVEVMAVILLGASFLGTVWQTIGFFRLVGLKFGIDLPLMRELTRTTIPFFIYGVLAVIYARIDVFLLSLMTNSAVVGWYGASYRLFDTLSFLPAIVITPIMYPLYSKFSISSEERLKLAIEKSMNFLLFFGIPITVGLIVVAPNIIGFLYQTSQFSNAIPALQMLAPGVLFLYMNTVLGNTLISTKRESKVPIIAGLCLVFNLGLNLLFIPLFQQVAAAAITSLTELLIFFASAFFLPKKLLPSGSTSTGVKSLIASIAMALVIWPLHTLSLFVILPVAMLAYFAAATLLHTIPREDLNALLKAIRRKGQQEQDGQSTSDGERVPETPIPPLLFNDIPTTPLPAYYIDALASIELATTMKLPAIKRQAKSPHSLKVVRLQPMEQRPLMQQEQRDAMGQGNMRIKETQ